MKTKRATDGAIFYSEDTAHLFIPEDDLRGRKFGRLEVIQFAYKRRKNYYYSCRCECGKEVVKSRGYLIYPYTSIHKSCGCWRLESQEEYRNKTYEYYKNMPEYAVWSAMKRRCNNPQNKQYMDYGGRGIKVCDRWSSEHDFANFIADMGKRPTNRHTLERIDVNGDYTPENCRWATYEEQANNKRCNINISYEGRTQTFKQWCKELNLPYYCAISMYKRGKRTFEEIVEYYKNRNV